MKRGSLNNIAESELWVLSSVVFVNKPNRWWSPWKKPIPTVREEIHNWIWESRHNLKLICIWIGEIPPIKESYFYQHKSFLSFQEARTEANRNSRVLEIITNNPDQVSTGVVLWEPSTKRYGR